LAGIGPSAPFDPHNRCQFLWVDLMDSAGQRQHESGIAAEDHALDDLSYITTNRCCGSGRTAGSVWVFDDFQLEPGGRSSFDDPFD
jgi:hypothetical protein